MSTSFPIIFIILLLLVASGCNDSPGTPIVSSSPTPGNVAEQYLFTETLGGNSGVSLSLTSNSVATVWAETPAFRTSALTAFRINVDTPGTFQLGVLVKNGDGTATILSRRTVIAFKSGLNTWLVDRDFTPFSIPKGGSVSVENGTGSYYYQDIPGTPNRYNAILSHPALNVATQIFNNPGAYPGVVGFDYDLQAQQNNSDLEYLSEFNSYGGGADPNGWTSTGWTLASGVAVNIATGLNSNLLV